MSRNRMSAERREIVTERRHADKVRTTERRQAQARKRFERGL